MIRKICIFLVALLVMSSFSVCAGNGVTAKYDFSDNSVEIIGTIGTDVNVPVTVLVSKIADKAEFSDSNLPVAAFLTKTGEGGTVSVKESFVDALPGGVYYIYLVSANGEANYDFLVFDPSSYETLAVVQKVNSETNVSLLTTYLSENIEKVGIRYSDVSSYISSLSSFLVSYKASVGVSYDLTSLVKVIKYVALISEIKDGTNADTTLSKYIDSLDVTYDDYSSLDSDVKTEVANILKESNYLNNSTKITFEELVLVAKARASASLWSSLKQTLMYNTTSYGIDTGVGSTYDKIHESQKQNVFYNAINAVKKATTIADVTKAFNDSAVKIYKEASANSKPSSSGGGGGFIAPAPSTVPVTPIIPEPEVSTPVEETNAFSDTADHFAKDEIAYLSENGIINGYTDNSFKPDNSISRAEFAAIVFRAFEIAKANSDYAYADVSADDWYFEAVSALSELGIITGDGNGFNPDSRITRQDASVILGRLLKLKNVNAEKANEELSDMPTVSDYAKESVEMLNAKGIIKGYNGMFRPLDEITRGETAIVIYRTIKLFEEVAK
ncbi:MAG: S-layer homology domain-containing protein [Clostridia bacterium]|nr:S-layer homology domain-containing protein [Clostridia bacterium]